MDFKKAALLGTYLSKDYAEAFFRLLVNYKSISASEAASRLNLHIRTAQDFLEAMSTLELIKKEEVYERKRPYFRYTLVKNHIELNINLRALSEEQQVGGGKQSLIREQLNSGIQFTTARNGSYFSNLTLLDGEGRDAKIRKISLTEAQGKFLFNLPFPDAKAESIKTIMEKAKINDGMLAEIKDIVKLLIDSQAIEEI